MNTKPLFTCEEGKFYETDNTVTRRVKIVVDTGGKGYCTFTLKSRDIEEGKRLAGLLNEGVETILIHVSALTN